MGNGIEGSPELESATPLELALDRATEQYMASLQERRGRRRTAAPTSTGAPASTAASTSTAALVVHGQHEVLPARLSWRGIEVTEEFQEYAMRVARGEQLAPFRGQVLARPCHEFPWGAPQNETTSTEPLPHFRSRGPRVAAWLLGFGALLMAGLGIGSGTADPAAELEPFVLPATTTALALRPAPREDDALAASEEGAETRIASAIESALAHAVPASEGSRAAPRAPSAGLATLRAAPGLLQPPAASSGAAPSGAVASSRPATSSVGAPSASQTTSSVVTSRAPSSPSAPSAAPQASLLAPSSPSSAELPRSSALFSDSPPF